MQSEPIQLLANRFVNHMVGIFKLDSSFRSASFRMTFFACHSEEGTTEESQRLQLWNSYTSS